MAKKRPRGRPFEGVGDARNGPGRPRTEWSDDTPPAADDDPNVSTLLRDMRQVCEQRPGRNDTPGQQAFRRLLEDDPKTFLVQLAKLEEQYRESQANSPRTTPQQASPEVPLGMDETSALVVDEIDRWLAAHKAKTEGTDEILAERDRCAQIVEAAEPWIGKEWATRLAAEIRS
jgi:hypothetical protein